MKNITALDVSKYLVQKANEIDENDLTNLKLQKLLYFIQVKFLEKKGDVLFPDQIEAWQLGPVVREVYNKFKSCGPFPITPVDVTYSFQELPQEIKTFVDGVWDEYAKYSSGYLVDLTHKVGSPWYKAFHSEDKTIGKELMMPSLRAG